MNTTLTRPAGPPAAAARGRKEGFGRPTSHRAEATSDWLRRGSSDELRRRRKAVGYSLAAVASLGVVALYQVGLVKHLPDPPLGVFDSDRVDASGEAYVRFDTPDALIGMASYAVTAALAAMGGKDRAQRRPLLALAVAGKAASDAVGAGVLTVEQISKHRKLCFWCTVAAGATFAALPQVLPDVTTALRALRES